MVITAFLVSLGCASTSPPGAAPDESRTHSLAADVSPYLLDPVATYPGQLDGGRAARLSSAYQALIAQGQVRFARRIADELLAIDSHLDPARVLAAESRAGEGDFAAARDLLAAVAAAHPEYLAARLLLARSLEALGALPEAYSQFREVAGQSALAARRAGELLQPAAAALLTQIREGLAGGSPEVVEPALAQLVSWAPDAPSTLEAAWWVAAARQDPRRELAALRRLVPENPGRTDWMTRQAELEVAVGEPGAAVELYQRLAAADPADPALAKSLAIATFHWRLGLLPSPVRAHLGQAALSRAGFANLLYWLVPDVRYGKPATGRIAVDILDRPDRDPVARVINLGLMEVDPSEHRFSPEAPVNRGTALKALLAVLAQRGASCLPRGAIPSMASLCRLAHGCGLIAEAAECPLREPLSGQEASELIRLTLQP